MPSDSVCWMGRDNPMKLSQLWTRIKERGTSTVVIFSGSSILLQIVVMISNIAVLKWLDPAVVGKWQYYLALQSYLLFIQIGVISGIGRELPYAMGKKDAEGVLGIAGTAYTYVKLVALLIIAAIPFIYLFGPATVDKTLLSAIILTAVCQLFRNYYSSTYRADSAFRNLAHITWFESGLTVATLPVVYYFGLDGLIIRLLAIQLITTTVLHLYRPIRQVGKFTRPVFGQLLRTGVPISAFGYLMSIVNTFPRMILQPAGGFELVGYYAPAAAVMGMISMVPQSLSRYVYPRMSYEFGKAQDPAILWKTIKKIYRTTFLISIPPVLMAMLFIPDLIRTFFPKYVGSIGAVQYSMFAGVFMGGSVALNALNVVKAWKRMSMYVGFRLIGGFGLPYLGFLWMGTLEGLSAGLVLFEMLTYGLGFWILHRMTHPRSQP